MVQTLLNDKTIKSKQKVIAISQLLLDRKLEIQQLIALSDKVSDINKGTIIESVELASRMNPGLVDEKVFEFIIQNLKSDAPRVKWESAKVIANTAHQFPKLLKKAVANLLDNTEHPGTVVRWSAAGALSKIILCKTDLNKDLIPAVEAILKREEDNAIKKIYLHVLKKVTK